MSTLTPSDLTAIRAQFPALQNSPDYVFAENAGGSQVLSSVAHSISNYLLSTNVQMGAYPLAQVAAAKVARGTCAAAALLGAESPDNVMIGQSATSLVASLAGMLQQKGVWSDGEMVISDADHETNRGAWTRLAKNLGLVLRDWPVTPLPSAASPFEVTLDPALLKGLLSPKTRLVAFTACSNLLGAYTDIPAAVQVIRSIAPEALIVVDCVAFAPHRRLNPTHWGVDIAFFSLYKTYGAHVGAMHLSNRVKTHYAAKMNHFFLHEGNAMYTWQTSSVQYELNASIAAVADYVVAVGRGRVGRGEEVDWTGVFEPTSGTGIYTSGDSTPAPLARSGLVKLTREEVDTALDAAFAKIAAHEDTLLTALLPALLRFTGRGLRIVGPTSHSSADRAPTVAFVIIDPTTGNHRVGTSQQIHQALVKDGQMGAQQGHMYAHKLVSSLGLDLGDGVVRVSFVHYNTVEEVERVVGLVEKVLEQVL